MRIPTKLAQAVLVRGTILWGLGRLMAMASLAMAAAMGPGGGGPPPRALLPLWCIAISALLVLADLRRRKELMLLHNLGVPTMQAVLLGTLPSIGVEAIVIAIPR